MGVNVHFYLLFARYQQICT